MLHLGSIRGTTIDVDFSFLILIFFFVMTNYRQEQGIQYALLWAPILFVSVLVHELAHAAMIGLFGYGASSIVLGGMGGVTMNRRRARPWQDMLISLAGPLSSFALGFFVFWLLRNVPAARRDPMLVALLPLMIWANFAWGILNLIPISPLDGGHAVRNFLRMFLSDLRAFPIAVWIGMISGVLVAFYFAMTQQFFAAIFLAWMVWMNFQQWQDFRQRGIPGD